MDRRSGFLRWVFGLATVDDARHYYRPLVWGVSSAAVIWAAGEVVSEANQVAEREIRRARGQ
jgi:hypothetical protein